MFGLDHLSVAQNGIVFGISAVFVWIAGTRLALCGDALAERFKLNHVFVGLIFLAAVTELPEIVTTITAARVENAALVLGNMFGGITMQTAILAIADIFVVRQALTAWPRKPTHALVATMLIVLLSFLLVVILVGDILIVLDVGLGAMLLFLAYPAVIVLLRRFDEKSGWAPVDLPDEGLPENVPVQPLQSYHDLSTTGLLWRTVLQALIILAAGVALALSADEIAAKSNLGSSFVGISMLAAATSLPELSTTIAAARIGAYTLAIANIFGSNLIMIALILPADLAYRAGPILTRADMTAQLSIVAGITVTAIYVCGILIRRTPVFLGAGIDSWLVLLVYLASLVAVFQM